MAHKNDTYDYFYWYTENLFKRCQNDIIYQTKNVRSDNGTSLIDRYVMTDKDEKYFMRMLKASTADVFLALQSVCKGLEDAFIFDESLIDTVDTLVDVNGVIYTTEMHDDFQTDMVNKLDSDLEEAIVSGVLYRWWYNVGLPEFANRERQNYDELRNNIKKDINSRTTLVTRPTSMI